MNKKDYDIMTNKDELIVPSIARVIERRFLKMDNSSDTGIKVKPNKVIISKGALFLTATNKWAPILESNSDLVFETTERGKGLRSCRRIPVRLFDILAEEPDCIILGPGMTDWFIELKHGQPKVDIHKFGSTMEYVVYTTCELFKTPILFLYSHPLGDSVCEENMQLLSASVARQYYDCLAALTNKYDFFHVLNMTSLLQLSPPSLYLQRQSFPYLDKKLVVNISRAIVDKVRAVIPEYRNFYQVAADTSDAPVFREMPCCHLIADDNVVLKKADHRLKNPNLLALLNFPNMLDENQATDEEDSGIDKLLENPGGRSIDEYFRQIMIIKWLYSQHINGAKRVLIVGDSIKMRISDATGYGMVAYANLLNKCNLIHIPHNCGNTRVSIKYLENWLSTHPDIIHMNHGLHDCAINPKTGGPARSHNPVDVYRQNLHEIVKNILGARTAKGSPPILIWGLCTPVDEDWHTYFSGTSKYRRITRKNADIERYNEIACEVMAEHHVSVTDFYTPLRRFGIRNFVLPDGVHLNNRGSVLVGELVSNTICKFL